MTVLRANPDVISDPTIEFRDLGRMDYRSALQVQRECQQQVIDSRNAQPRMIVLLVEHDPPVITISRRPGARTHLTAQDSQLQIAGVEVCETDRGGDITYHGPGQLVVYPILDLNALHLRMVSYLRFLEQTVIESLAQFGIQGERDESATGVWVRDPSTAGASASKICAIGVRVSRWVSMHGFAMNVTTNLDHFNLIVPCGLAGRSVTSMQRILGAQCPDMRKVKRVVWDTIATGVTRSAHAQTSEIEGAESRL